MQRRTQNKRASVTSEAASCFGFFVAFFPTDFRAKERLLADYFYTGSLKKASFRMEPPYIGHYREYPPKNSLGIRGTRTEGRGVSSVFIFFYFVWLLHNVIQLWAVVLFLRWSEVIDDKSLLFVICSKLLQS